MLTISLARRQVLLMMAGQTALSSLWSQASTVVPTALANSQETPLPTISTPEAASTLMTQDHRARNLPPPLVRNLPPPLVRNPLRQLAQSPPLLRLPLVLHLQMHLVVAMLAHLLFSSVMLVVTVVLIGSTGSLLRKVCRN
jgi:hypothetical protein